MPLLDEGEVDEHRPDLGVLMVLEDVDADVIEVSHAPAIVAAQGATTPVRRGLTPDAPLAAPGTAAGAAADRRR